MVQYTPPPPNLDHLNPVQRYMQKGSLDRQDWIRLGAIILAYFVIRPYLQSGAKWLLGSDKVEEGEKAKRDYQQRRAKVSANAIRSGKKGNDDIAIEDLDEDEEVVTSGTKVDDKSAVVNRKSKAQATSKKPVEDQLLDWDDEPGRERAEGDKEDVMQWLDKWDK